MKNCPVCGAEHTAPVCPACSFDFSCDFEASPTLTPLPEGIASVSRRKAQQELKQVRLKRVKPREKKTSVYCPNCGRRVTRLDSSECEYC